MARKKAPQPKELPREERPEFLALLAELPSATERAELERIAGAVKAVFNDAVRVGDAARADLAMMGWDAVVCRLNGDTFFGCNADGGSQAHLLKHLAAKPGQVPAWGQDGEWLTEVQGLRIRVKARHWMMETISLDLFAVDLDQPYLSPTGYRSHYLDHRQWFGHDFGAAVRLEIERQLSHKDWRLKPIDAEDRARRAERDMPAWLAPALEGVTHNGQQALPLSGRAPVELPVAVAAESEAPKAPMSNKERQKAFRQRQKEEREQAKAAGLVPLELDADERQLLARALRFFEHVSITDERAGGDVSALRAKVAPGGYSDEVFTTFGQWEQRQKVEGLRTVQLSLDEDCLLLSACSALFTARADLKWLESDRTWERLGRIFQDSPLWTEQARAELDQDQGIINGAKRIENERRRGWKLYEDERKQNRGLGQKLFEAQEENKRLKAALAEIGDVMGGTVPAAKAGPAPEVAALQAEVARLRARLDQQHNDNLGTIAELGKAGHACERLQRRLEKAGLPYDYRAQPGEL
ncbi:hypothetical protein V0R55_24800 [Pseudomonas soli]|uniref:Uncharacterized protein n=1 Tax=Pseudomonas soli TaxID=1306993 RepID=A0ABU7GX68_9PSED|nr:hypothetical protein [Pseudomonas soli]MEE1883388.1 hypothetical protein [Pseudomonas soli]